MEKYNVNIKKVSTIKDLVDVAWLLELKAGDEVTLEVDASDESPLFLRAVLICLSVELLRNHSRVKKDINYNAIAVTNFASLATALTQVTGFKLSISKI